MSTSSFGRGSAWSDAGRKRAGRTGSGTWDDPEIVTPAGEWLRHIEKLAHLMDSKYRLPGTNFRFGLDPILGLIPGVGNIATSAVSIGLLFTMLKHGASGNVVARMAVNVLLDSLIGAIPIVGNLFDFAYRANNRNVELLRRHYDEGVYQGSGWGILAGVGTVIFLVLGFAAWLVFKLIAGVFDLLF